jgi:3-deoxy-D-manno-octulosonic acid kinase
MTEKTLATGRAAILYDGDLLDHADEALFMPPAEARSPAGGRGHAWIVRHGGGEWVLRHYRRGGLAARVFSDSYFWTGLEATRPWREWRLLHALYKEGLPVPQPLAAQVVRNGLLYRGDLVTRRIPGTRSLAERLTGGERIPWDAVGRCVRRFHDAGVFHADLNAHNVLLDGAGGIYLLDFDRGELRAQAPGWQLANITRLKRSLEKLSGGRLDTGAWKAMLDGYGKRG